MRKSKFTDQQVAFVLRQAEEGASVGEVCRKAGVSEATYYKRHWKHGGLMPSDMQPLAVSSTMERTCASFCLKVPEASMPITRSPRSRSAKPAIVPPCVEPVTKQPTM